MSRLSAFLVGPGLVLLLAAAAGCGSSASDSATPKTSRSASPSGSAGPRVSAAEQQRLQAKLLVDAPPEDLIWRYPTVPSSWQRLTVERGSEQWRIGDTVCAVTLNQPAGLGAVKDTSADTIARYVDDFASSVKLGAPTTDLPGTRLQPQLVNNGAVTGQVKVATLDRDYGPDIHVEGLGYRNGDFALRFVATCGKDQWPQVREQVREFAGHLSVSPTY